VSIRADSFLLLPKKLVFLLPHFSTPMSKGFSLTDNIIFASLVFSLVWRAFFSWQLFYTGQEMYAKWGKLKKRKMKTVPRSLSVGPNDKKTQFGCLSRRTSLTPSPYFFFFLNFLNVFGAYAVGFRGCVSLA
jgi:hypothetical protein